MLDIRFSGKMAVGVLCIFLGACVNRSASNPTAEWPLDVSKKYYLFGAIKKFHLASLDGDPRYDVIVRIVRGSSWGDSVSTVYLKNGLRHFGECDCYVEGIASSAEVPGKIVRFSKVLNAAECRKVVGILRRLDVGRLHRKIILVEPETALVDGDQLLIERVDGDKYSYVVREGVLQGDFESEIDDLSRFFSQFRDLQALYR